MRYFLLIFIFGCSQLMAQSAQEDFAKALQAQTNSNIPKAIQLYESIGNAAQVSATAHNNLALAYIKNKQLGKGILHLERALRLDCRHADAHHNLKAANQRILVPLQSSTPIFFVRWWNGLVHSLSSTAWALLFLLIFGGGIACLSAGYWRSIGKYRNWGVILIMFSSLPMLWGFQQKANELDNSAAIIIKTEVGIRQAPELNSPEIELVHEGIKVKILEQKDTWVHVQLPNHLIGWMPSKMLERI